VWGVDHQHGGLVVVDLMRGVRGAGCGVWGVDHQHGGLVVVDLRARSARHVMA